MFESASSSHDARIRISLCDAGSVVTTELVLVAVIALIGLVVALSTMRESVVSEFVDASLGIQSTNQSFTFSGMTSGSATIAGASWTDKTDGNDGQDISGAVVGMDFSVAPENEISLEDFIQSRDFRFQMTRSGSSWDGNATFDSGRFNGAPFWPGDYSIDGSTITVMFDPIGFGWNEGTLVLDASNMDNISGTVTWINSIIDMVWVAFYQLFPT